MTDNNHPITPPPELVRQWMERTEYDEHTWFYESYIAEQAARWGADQELLACGDYLEKCAAWEPEDVTEFYNYRRPRPKPPSLKEQALEMLDCIPTHDNQGRSNGIDLSIIRRALEQLND